MTCLATPSACWVAQLPGALPRGLSSRGRVLPPLGSLRRGGFRANPGTSSLNLPGAAVPGIFPNSARRGNAPPSGLDGYEKGIASRPARASDATAAPLTECATFTDTGAAE